MTKVVPEPSQALPRAAYNRGNNHLRAGNYDGAIQAFTEALRLDPNHAAAYYERGLVYARKGEYDRARIDFNKLLELGWDVEVLPKLPDSPQSTATPRLDTRNHDSNDAITYYERGLAYARKGEYDRAIQDYDQAIRLDPNLAGVYYLRGATYRRKGEYDRARSDLYTALVLGYDRATVEGALALLPVAQSRTTNDAAAAYNRGIAHARKGEYDRAIQDYDQVLKLPPNDALASRAYTSRGFAYVNTGLYDRAIQDFNRAIMLDPNYANTYYGRGFAYTRKGEYDRAWSDFHTALVLGYDRAEVEAMLARLPD